MASINTNYGASIALQNLNKTNSELERTQNRINTATHENEQKHHHSNIDMKAKTHHS